MSRAARRTALRLVPNPPPADDRSGEEWVHFCSHCSARPTIADHISRVCDRCGFGVLLEASAGSAPAPGGAFLVVDGAMSICAISRGAEELLEIRELQAVHRHLTELLAPADTEIENRGSLAFAISAAVNGGAVERRFMLRPANLYGVRLPARVGSCGPRPAALVVLGH